MSWEGDPSGRSWRRARRIRSEAIMSDDLPCDGTRATQSAAASLSHSTRRLYRHSQYPFQLRLGWIKYDAFQLGLCASLVSVPLILALADEFMSVAAPDTAGAPVSTMGDEAAGDGAADTPPDPSSQVVPSSHVVPSVEPSVVVPSVVPTSVEPSVVVPSVAGSWA